MNARIGNLIVVAAASGAGKTSLVNALMQRDDRVRLSISHTTRPKRPGEVADEHYHFIDRNQFDEMVQQGEFLEHAEVFDHHYGTARGPVLKKMEQGHDVLLEIDWQGAQQIRERFDEVISIFIVPPSIEELERRLNRRGQDSAEVIARRMAKARAEMRHFQDFDLLIVNDDFDKALHQLCAAVEALRLRMQRQVVRHRELLEVLTGEALK